VKHRILAAVAALAFPLATLAASPELDIPDFSGLRGRAVESVDVTVDGFLMRVAHKFAEASDDEEMKLLSDIKSVRVRNFEFDSDGAYSTADIDAVRRQLSAPGWSPLAQVHKRDPQEVVDVFVCTEDGKILGLAIIASEPRSFTIVNIIGGIDMEKLAKLDGKFGIPKMDVEQ
jgi:uncharacterized protein DUF4252